MDVPATRRTWAPQVVVAAMLLWALYPENPYGYFTLLKWVVCPVFVFLAFLAHSQGKTNLAWLLGIVAVVHNPLIPFRLSRELWNLLDVVSAGVALASIAFLAPVQAAGSGGAADSSSDGDRDPPR